MNVFNEKDLGSAILFRNDDIIVLRQQRGTTGVYTGDIVVSNGGRQFYVQDCGRAVGDALVYTVLNIKPIKRPLLPEGWEYESYEKEELPHTGPVCFIYDFLEGWTYVTEHYIRVVSGGNAVPCNGKRWIVRKKQPKRPALPAWYRYVSNEMQCLPEKGPVMYLSREMSQCPHDVRDADIVKVGSERVVASPEQRAWIVEYVLPNAYLRELSSTGSCLPTQGCMAAELLAKR